MRIFKTAAVFLCLVVTGAILWLSLHPPELLRVGDGYAAKIVCSNVFLAGRDPSVVLAEDVQAPGNPLLKLVRVTVDKTKGEVTARIAGLFAPGYALNRPGFGCASVPDGDFDTARSVSGGEPPAWTAETAGLWPDGPSVSPPNPALTALATDPALAGPAMRAIVIVHDGRIVGEAYGKGFTAQTPLLGWSMTKSVNAAIIGRMMSEGKLGFEDRGLFPTWLQDARREITIADLMAMQSGLAFNEEYGSVTDVTRMLYLDPDMAQFGASRPLDVPPGTKFRYSTGGAVLLSRIWMDRLGNQAAALRYPSDALFKPLGMRSAVLETDARGTFVGGSYLYAKPRDWARFGQFLLQGGHWQGQSLLPDAFVTAMHTPASQSAGLYSQAQTWLAPPHSKPSQDVGLPADTMWVQGHDGQSIAIIPSAKLVVLRMGLTPSRLNYRPEELVKRVLAALQ